MATQYTAGLTSGQILTAAIMNQIGAAWETYTPGWLSQSGTNPAIGNGTLSGRYMRIQRLVVAQIFVLAGSTTTFGTGAYKYGLPIAANTSNLCFGVATVLDASAGYVAYNGVVTTFDTNYVEFRTHAAQVNSGTVPVTLANADQIRLELVYESAS